MSLLMESMEPLRWCENSWYGTFQNCCWPRPSAGTPVVVPVPVPVPALDVLPARGGTPITPTPTPPGTGAPCTCASGGSSTDAEFDRDGVRGGAPRTPRGVVPSGALPRGPAPRGTVIGTAPTRSAASEPPARSCWFVASVSGSTTPAAAAVAAVGVLLDVAVAVALGVPAALSTVLPAALAAFARRLAGLRW